MRLLVILVFATCDTLAVKYSSRFNAGNSNATAEVSSQNAREKTDSSIDDFVARSLSQLDERSERIDVKWPMNIIGCTRELGISKCLKAFATTRVEKSAKIKGDIEFDLARELDAFKWGKFVNVSEGEMETRMARSFDKMMRERKITLATFPGVLIDIDAAKSGSLNIDLRKDPENELDESRGQGGGGGGGGGGGNKKFLKRFYGIVPFLLMPGLVMAAILPFVLPALFLMSAGASLLNQIALWGASFTLMRNNAFDDKYEKRVIYINEGYKNEHKYHQQHEQPFADESPYLNEEPHFDDGHPGDFGGYHHGGGGHYNKKRRVSSKLRRQNPTDKPWSTRVKGTKDFEEEVEYEIPEEFLNSPSMEALRKGHLFKDMLNEERFQGTKTARNPFRKP